MYKVSSKEGKGSIVSPGVRLVAGKAPIEVRTFPRLHQTAFTVTA
jgi:hypothetical protein